MTSEAIRSRRHARARLLRAAILAAAGSLAIPALHGIAQEHPAATAPADPRVGLKPGLRDPGVAIRNMELVASLPKPEGFFDRNAPAGETTPPEPPPSSTPESASQPANEPGPAGQPPSASFLRFANSDLAFSRNRLFVGNFNGFNVYDIKESKPPKLVASIVCPGGQGDVSVHGNLLFMSVEETRGRIDCGTQGVQAPISVERFRGVRIFDITDLKKPKQLAAVQTCRGSHTHTLVTTPRDTANVYVYGSGTSTVRSGEELAGCSGLDPKEDPDTALFSIDVIQVPLAAPDKARIVNRPRIFADPATGNISGLWPGGNHGPGTQTSSVTNRCHDITVFPEIGLAAGACSGNGILLDISDPVHPSRLDSAADKNFAFWHSATFNNDGSKVIFTDEWGGGTRPRCRSTDLPSWGADAIFEVVDRKLRFGGYFKMPAAQTEQENCVAHNGSIVPVPGRDIMVQGWYQGGISVFDFTDAAHPIEIAFFDRGPIDAARLITAGFWSAYWFNGRIYGTEIARGLDVLRLTPSDQLTKNEIDAANLIRYDEFNAQLQPKATWPATPVVARAYVDQLTRSKGIQPARASAISAALERADTLRTGKEKGAAELARELDTLATELEGGAGTATGIDAIRQRSLASTLKGLAATLR
jgi:hypothetical protein